MSDIEEFKDAEGNLRRLGSLIKEENFVSVFKTYEVEKPVYDDKDIIKLVTDGNRVRSRVKFGNEWICNQFSVGSCNGWALAQVYARARWRRGIRDKLLFSGAYTYSKINGGRDQGSILEHGMKQGLIGNAPIDLVKWNEIYPSMYPRSVDQEAEKYKAFESYAVETLQGLKTALALGYDCIVAIHAGSAFSKLNQQGICGVNNGIGNHAVTVDDLLYTGGRFLYDMPNSWGTGFGQNGRGYLTEEHFAQTMKYHQFYCVPSTLEG